MAEFSFTESVFEKDREHVFLGRCIQACSDLDWEFVCCKDYWIEYRTNTKDEAAVLARIIAGDDGRVMLIYSGDGNEPESARELWLQFRSALNECTGDDEVYESLYVRIREMYASHLTTTDNNNESGWKSMIKPDLSKNYFFTPLLIWVNSVVFAITFLFGFGWFESDPGSAVTAGGNIGILTLNGEPWRLITYQFLHGGGLIHILSNMFFLLLLGRLLEVYLGSWYFIVLYLLTGAGAGMLSVYGDSLRVSTGASGAVFGLFGAAVLILIFERIYNKTTVIEFWRLGLILFIMIVDSLKEDVDGWAHAGGLISGALLGLFFSLNAFFFKVKNGKWFIAAAGGLVSVMVFFSLPRHGVVYNQLSKRYINAVWHAYNYQQKLDTGNLENRLHSIMNMGVNGWQKAVAISDSMRGILNKSGIPKEEKSRVMNYKKLALAGRYSSELYYRAWKQQTNQLDDSLLISYHVVDSLYWQAFPR